MGIFNLLGDVLRLLEWMLSSIGCFALFKKDGIKRIYAFIPGLREYHLAVMAERQEDGRTFLLLSICVKIAQIMQGFFQEGSLMNGFWAVVVLAIVAAEILFGVRIYSALCGVFNVKRKWVWLWTFFSGITSLIWGFSPKFVPNHTNVVDTDYDKAAKISGATVEALQNGLTVNLTDRTAVNMGKKIYLLKDVHISIPVGHMVLLLGGSGAGKTTFLNAVTGYEKANAQIFLGGRDLYNNYDNMKYELGFVPQQDLMRLNDTVNMTLADAAKLRLPCNKPKDERDKLIDSVLDKLGLCSVRNSQVGKLSGGQRKRLSIALELISDPMLFILDEPDSGLDGVVARNLFETLRKIADEGKIVIVITHTPDRVIDLFDDVIVLAKDASRTGRLAYFGPIEASYKFFGKQSMEEILLSINQKDEGGEGRADEFVEKYTEKIS